MVEAAFHRPGAEAWEVCAGFEGDRSVLVPAEGPVSLGVFVEEGGADWAGFGGEEGLGEGGGWREEPGEGRYGRDPSTMLPMVPLPIWRWGGTEAGAGAGCGDACEVVAEGWGFGGGEGGGDVLGAVAV